MPPLPTPGGGHSCPGLGRLDQHPAHHLHVQRMAEPAAVVPMHARLVGHKGDGGGLLGADLHAHAMVHHHEAVGHVFDHIDVGDHHGHLIALLDLKLVNPECRRHGGHVDAHLVTVTANL